MVIWPSSGSYILKVLAVQFSTIGTEIASIGKSILAWHRSCEPSRRLEEIPGVGPIVATALVAEIGDWKAFKSGRGLAAWIGLVPKQHTTGGKDECRDTDFSKFETFDNYCVAMFSFEYLYSQTNGFTPRELINLNNRSSRFLEAIAAKDDIFFILDSGQVKFDKLRYEQKVMTRWRGGLDNRNIRPIASL